ncbi:MAG TPA: purine-nucleoside phosphorylase [Flavisolibacter sp.]|jgi:purine-nucleoside phosphorylase|nr:purine-nucleoside phosphorylase [Flavisolibacter sp.]
MQDQLAAIQETAAFLRTTTGVAAPRVGIVLGTGLNAFTEHIEEQKCFPYSGIPHFPQTTVSFHKGQLIFGKVGGVPVVAMQGRFHYYEGYSMQEITFPVRVMKELGIEVLLLSNAAGGMNPDYKKGDLVIVDDHINMLPDNPLRGLGEEFGNRFADMSQPYNRQLQILMQQEFEKQNIPEKIGVYVSVMGPNLETRAEYRWLRQSGGDMVGMSTVPEVIVANQLGLSCGAISVITDECDPDHLKPVNIAEIIEVAGKADATLSLIFRNTIEALQH